MRVKFYAHCSRALWPELTDIVLFVRHPEGKRWGEESDYYGVYGLAKPDTVPFPVVIYALVEWLWLPTVGLLAIYLQQ